MISDTSLRFPDFTLSRINSLPEGVILQDSDGTILEVNAAALRILGWERPMVVGAKPPYRWWQHGDWEWNGQAPPASAQSGAFVRADGISVPVSVTRTPLSNGHTETPGTISIIIDEAADQHRNSETPNIAVIVLNANRCVQFWGDGAQTVLGQHPDQAIGQALPALLGQPVAQTVSEVLSQAEQQGTASTNIVHGATVGGSRDITLRVTTLRDHNGTTLGFVCAISTRRLRMSADIQLQVQFQVARVLANANALGIGLHRALQTIGDAFEWPLGAVWIPDRDGTHLRCRGVWHAAGIDAAEFARVSRDTTFSRDEGLPGRIWSSDTPTWIRSLAHADTLPRQQVALQAGMRSAMAFPIETERTPLGIVEFYFHDERTADPDVTSLLMALGQQIGQFIARLRVINALRDSESRFRVMADGAPVMLWVAAANGEMTYVNRGWLDFTGRALHEETGNDWTTLIHPDDRAACQETRAHAFADQQPYKMEYRLKRRDGTYRWLLDTGSPRFDSDGTFAGLVGSCVDIHDRRQAEQDQRFLSEATRILTSSLDYHATLTRVTQLTVPALADWCRLYLTEDHSDLQQIAAAHPAPGTQAWAQALDAVFAQTTPTHTGLAWVMQSSQMLVLTPEGKLPIPDGTLDTHLLDALRDNGVTAMLLMPIIVRGKAVGVFAVAYGPQGRQYGDAEVTVLQHLTRRMAVAIDNARLYRDAQDAVRVRDQFLAVAAHELRSPLTAMKGFAQLLLRRATRSGAQDDWIGPLQTIDAQINRMTDLVNRLLDVSRIQERHLQILTTRNDLVDIVTVAVSEAQMATDQHVISYEGTHDPLIADVDRTRIAQVLSNLLSNAVRYSPAGTPITVRARQEADSIIIAVHDIGAGIPMERREHIFDRYFRGDAALHTTTEGMGLGLYVANGIISAHGGHMWFESEPGEGTTFLFSIPCTPAEDVTQ